MIDTTILAAEKGVTMSIFFSKLLRYYLLAKGLGSNADLYVNLLPSCCCSPYIEKASESHELSTSEYCAHSIADNVQYVCTNRNAFENLKIIVIIKFMI